jgi:hypothetical protein
MADFGDRVIAAVGTLDAERIRGLAERAWTATELVTVELGEDPAEIGMHHDIAIAVAAQAVVVAIDYLLTEAGA